MLHVLYIFKMFIYDFIHLYTHHLWIFWYILKSFVEIVILPSLMTLVNWEVIETF